MDGKKILMIIDDDRDDRFFFHNAIKNLGDQYEYREAQHGAEALIQLRQTETLPDYIFMDINMPVMDGAKCLTELKKDQRLKNIPVIIYSTSTCTDDMELTRKLGAIDYLIKPWNILKLHENIIDVIRKAEETTARRPD